MSNHKLSVIGGQADQAFLNRMAVLEFDRSIPLEKQDTKLSSKLKEKEEIDAVVAWALEGVQRLYRNNFKLTHVPNPDNYILSNASANPEKNNEILKNCFREYLNKTFEVDSKNKEVYVSVPEIFDRFKGYIGATEDFEYKDTLCLHNILQDEFELIKKRVQPSGQKKQIYVYFGLLPR
jgi:hypothetical protein